MLPLVAAAVYGPAGAASARGLSSGEQAPVQSASPVDEMTAEAVPGTTSIEVSGGGYSGGLTLPGEPSEDEVSAENVPNSLDLISDEALVSTEYGGSRITAYPAEVGSQTLIEVPDANAPREYGFDMMLPRGSTAAVEADGSVSIRDMQGDLLGGYEAPWAIDANNQRVPTSFRVEGDTLIQFVDTSATDAFPVIADPSDLWGWAHCIGVVTVTVAGNAFVATKVAKLVTRFGSISRATEVMVRAWRASPDPTKRTQAVVNAVGSVGAEIVGVTDIKNACFS